MNKRLIVVVSAMAALVLFSVAAALYRPPVPDTAVMISDVASGLVRAHSPVIGPPDAAVTITEFFDPSCEACRAFYPAVKQIMAKFPSEVRLVLRYAAFHEGSDQAVGILEAARKQDRFIPVLEALLARQSEWAIHGAPDLDKAWAVAAAAGINLPRARADASRAEVKAMLEQDAFDIQTYNVRQTPTFFVNGKPLTAFGQEQLEQLVDAEVNAARVQLGQ